jgi:hypothetical protein
MRTYEVIDPQTKKIVGLFHQSWEPVPRPPVITQRQSPHCPHCPHCQALQTHGADELPSDAPDWGTWQAETNYPGPCRDEPAGWGERSGR